MRYVTVPALALVLILAAAFGQGAAAQVSEDEWQEARDLAALFGALVFVEDSFYDADSGELLSIEPQSVGIDHENLTLDLLIEYCVRASADQDCVWQRNAFWENTELSFADLDPDLTGPASWVSDSGESYDMLELVCAGERDCVTFTDIPPGETYREDILELRCESPASCEAAGETVAALIARARPATEPTPKPGPPPGAGITGTWGLFPTQPGGGAPRWMLDFGTDGSYSFNDLQTGARHAGRYSAGDGGWSMSGRWENRNGVPASLPPVYTDGGSYRLLGPDLLELGGQFGTAVWSRIR